MLNNKFILVVKVPCRTESRCLIRATLSTDNWSRNPSLWSRRSNSTIRANLSSICSGVIGFYYKLCILKKYGKMSGIGVSLELVLNNRKNLKIWNSSLLQMIFFKDSGNDNSDKVQRTKIGDLTVITMFCRRRLSLPLRRRGARGAGVGWICCRAVLNKTAYYTVLYLHPFHTVLYKGALWRLGGVMYMYLCMYIFMYVFMYIFMYVCINWSVRKNLVLG